MSPRASDAEEGGHHRPPPAAVAPQVAARPVPALRQPWTTSAPRLLATARPNP